MISNVFFISVKKKIITHFPTKKYFSVFRGLPWAPPNTVKLFFGKMFFMLMKNIYLIISRFVSQNFVDLVKICVSKWNTFYIKCNKGLFLYVNQQRRFLDIQKIQKAKN